MTEGSLARKSFPLSRPGITHHRFFTVFVLVDQHQIALIGDNLRRSRLRFRSLTKKILCLLFSRHFIS
jgi:hypothetical protein